MRSKSLSIALFIAAGAFLIIDGNAGPRTLQFTITTPENTIRVEPGTAGLRVTAFSETGEALPALTDAGLPALPVRALNVLIPGGERVASVRARSVHDVVIARNTALAVAPAPEADPDAPAPRVLPEPTASLATVSSDGNYPSELVRYAGSGKLHGYTVASVIVYPVRREGDEVVASTEIELTVELETGTSDDAVRPARLTPAAALERERELRELVINPGDASGYPVPVTATYKGPFQPTSIPSLDGSPVDCVIITTEALAAPFDSLALWKTTRGVPTVVRTVEWIEANYRRGTDLAETIRFFLRDAYTMWGTQYILLAGDTQQVPARYLFSAYFYGGTEIPADIYYAGLDGSFNADGDNVFGEQPVDAPDLYPELNVGRLPVSYLSNANTIIAKIKAYETPADPEYTDKVLYLAEVLFPTPWSPGMTIQSNGAVIADEINTFVASPERRITRMFETPEIFPGSVPESRELAIDSLSSGYNMVFHIGHGYRFNMHCGDDNVSIPDADALQHPNREFNLFMLNCSAAAFDYDCLGEHLLFNPNGGSVSVVGSSNSAFPDQASYYAHGYAKAIYNSDERHIGKAFTESKLARTPFALLGDGADLWTHYVYTILADPEMSLWTGAVRYPSVTLPSSVPAGDNDIVVQVQVDGTPAAGAIVCLYKDREDFATGATNVSGVFSAPFSSARAGSISVVVTGKNLARTQRWIEVIPTGGAQLAVDSVIVDDDEAGVSSGNGDGRIDAGETIELRPRFRNVGGVPSLPSSSVLTTFSAGVAVVAGTVNIPAIQPDSAWTADGATWALITDRHASDRQRLLFDITTTHGTDTWSGNFATEMHAPELEILSLRTSDALPVGNGDGILSPGESYQLFATVKNYGSGDTGALAGTLTALDPGATVTVGNAGYPGLGQLESAENVPPFELSEANTLIENPLRLTIVDAMGRVTERTIELRPPAAPVIQSFDATLGLDKLQIVWDKSPSGDVAGYRVQRSLAESGPFATATLDIIAHTVFTDGGLTPSTRYYYTVTAIDSSGNESAPSPVGTASTNPPQATGWPNTIPDASANSPAIGDIDGDGYPEIIIGNDYLYAWHHNGQEVRDGDGQPATFGVFESVGEDFIGPPALGNIDGNPGLEIVAAAYTSREVYIFDGAGNVLPGWPQPTVDFVRANVALGDVDGDGSLDVVAVDQDAYLYVWHTDGTELIDGDANPATSGVFKRLPDTNQWQYQSPALADLDNDGKDEIIIATQDARLYVFNEDGGDLAGWPRTLPNYAGGGVAVGDIDNNGDLEIVVTVRGSGETYALNHDNTVMFTRWLQHNLFFNPSPVLADLTGDGKLETIIPCSNGKMYALQYNGSDAPGWPVTYSTKSHTECPAVVADVNGDGAPDVLLGDEEKLIGGWSAAGQPLDGFPLVIKDAMRGSPAVVDLDINGDAEIVAVGYDRTVYVWDLSTPFDPTHAPWPMGRANIHRNGRYGSSIATGIPGVKPPVARSVRLEQNHPNPFNPVTTIGFELPPGSHRAVLSIYDVTGARIRTLVDGVIAGGTHTVTWDGRNETGTPVGSGVYFYRLATENRSDTRKMVLLK